jgi:hypothetical protein
MTNAQYKRLYLASRRNASRITRTIINRLKDTYEDAALLVARQVRNAELAGLSDLTIRSWRNIQFSLQEGALMITDRLERLLNQGLIKSTGVITSIDETYLIDIIRENNININTISINNIFTGVNQSVLLSTINRIYENGYTYSQRIWNVGLNYQEQITKLITSDLAIGRDLVQTARDIEVYVQAGRRGLAKRWGDLLAGNTDWLRRIGKNIDYNALRIIRSELYASLQSAAVLDGQANPGATGWYEWIRQNSIDWGCNCPDNAAGSPYPLNDLPSYDHPNCLCRIVSVLRTRAEFVDDLKRWSEGESVGYLDEWNNDYLQFAA